MKCAKLLITYSIVLMFVVFRQAVFADDSPLEDVFLNDISNIAIGAFNLKKHTYLFSLPKDNPPTDRGVVWGEIFIFDDQGNKHSYVSIFDCGPVTGRFWPYLISFSEKDKYVAIESGGESGSVVDVFEVTDLYDEAVERGFNGTAECVDPIATLGGLNIPVTFYGWNENEPMIKSVIPLDQASTSEEVIELERTGKCCGTETQIFVWDFVNKKISLADAP